ncbi:hypothetical protein Tco_0597442 [Tanacetum coccineum]
MYHASIGYGVKSLEIPTSSSYQVATAKFAITKTFDFWSTIKTKTVNGEAQLQALVDGKNIVVTKASVRRDLQLEDDDGVDCLPDAIISQKRAGEALIIRNVRKKHKVDDEKLKQCMKIIPDDGDDVTIEAIPLSTKSPTIVDYKIYKEG